MLISDAVVFALALFKTGGTLLLFVYFIITLSDLECDYLNAQQCCEKLNMWILPKLMVHLCLSMILLLHGHWILTLINVPMAIWLAYEIATIPKGNVGLYDPTEIHNRGQLKKHMKTCLYNLGFYLILFFIYLYCLIISLLKGDPIKRHEDNVIVNNIGDIDYYN